jgi:hypothetical protein
VWERGAYVRPRGPRSLFTVPVAQKPPKLSSIRQEAWYLAERRASQIVRLVQPTVESNTKRTRVIAYVQKLIGTSIGTEVSSLISNFALKFFNLCWFCALILQGIV